MNLRSILFVGSNFKCWDVYRHPSNTDASNVDSILRN